MAMIDVTFRPNAHMVLSGDEIVIGANDDSVCIQTTEQGDCTYMSIAEARMLIAALEVAIESVGL